MKITLIVTIEHEKPIKDLPDIVAGRVWCYDGVTGAEAVIAPDSEAALQDLANQAKKLRMGY